IPRKMLPPPTTRQSSCPSDLAAAISPASPATASGSIPNWPGPIKASPDSLSRIRLKRGRVKGCPQDVTRAATPLWRSRPVANCKAVDRSGDRFGLCRTGRGGDLGSEVAGFLLDAFTELETDEVLDHDLGAGILRRRGDDIGDRSLVVANEQLRQ